MAYPSQNDRRSGVHSCAICINLRPLCPTRTGTFHSKIYKIKWCWNLTDEVGIEVMSHRSYKWRVGLNFSSPGISLHSVFMVMMRMHTNHACANPTNPHPGKSSSGFNAANQSGIIFPCKTLASPPCTCVFHITGDSHACNCFTFAAAQNWKCYTVQVHT